VQLLSAAVMLLFADIVQADVVRAGPAAVRRLTALFTGVTFLAATQDVAVDGWAVDLLAGRDAGYGSACQTLGMSAGWFLSFTVFTALQSAGSLCQPGRLLAWLEAKTGRKAWCPTGEVVTVAGWLRFAALLQLGVTAVAAFWPSKSSGSSAGFAVEPGRGRGQGRGRSCPRSLGRSPSRTLCGQSPSPARTRSASKRARPRRTGSFELIGAEGESGLVAGGPNLTPADDPAVSQPETVTDAYRGLWGVLRLPAVRRLSVLLLTYRLAFSPVEAAASLKLLGAGVRKEHVALLSLLATPVEVLFALVAGHIAAARGHGPGFALGMAMRFVASVATLVLIGGLVLSTAPAAAAEAGGGLGTAALASVAVVQFLTTASMALMFTSQGALFASVADPIMGGAYLTLLNTVANVGYTVPRSAVLLLMDLATVPLCSAGTSSGWRALRDVIVDRVVTALGANAWLADRRALACRVGEGGGVLVDGFFIVSGMFLAAGSVVAPWMIREFWAIGGLPANAWRVAVTPSPSGRPRRR